MSETVAVATWTLRQIDQARGLRAKAQIDAEMAHRYGDEVMAATRHELFKAIQKMAHPFVIEINAGDLEFHQYRDTASPFVIAVEARWNPTTLACEMRGGPRDGEVIAHQRPGEPILFPVIESMPYLLNDDATSAEVGWSERTVRYDLAGWSEGGRRWVYEQADA